MQAIIIPLKVSGIGAANVQLIALGKRVAALRANMQLGLGGSGGGGNGSLRGNRQYPSSSVNALMKLWGRSTPQKPAFSATQIANKQAKFSADLSIARRKGYVGPATESGVYQYMQAQRAMPKVPGKPASFGSNLMSAFTSSRFGMGGKGGMQLMPLVSKVLPLLGEFAAPLAIAVAGLKLLAEITMQAAENLKDFRNAMLTGGGSATETAIGRAIGDKTGDAAVALSQQISQGGIGAGYAARAGVSDPGGTLFGNVDKSQNLIKMADALRSMSRIDATRLTRALPALKEIFEKVYDLSARTYGQLKGAATLQGTVNDDDKVRAAANFNAQLDRTKINFETLTNIVGTPLMKAGTLILDFANGLLEVGIRLANSPLGKAIMGLMSPAIAAMGAISDMANPKNRESATDRNTRALEELAQVLRNGVYGGGERARGAIPHQWSGYNADQWAKQAMNLGAFTL